MGAAGWPSITHVATSAGISQDDYRATLGVLARMADNLVHIAA